MSAAGSGPLSTAVADAGRDALVDERVVALDAGGPDALLDSLDDTPTEPVISVFAHDGFVVLLHSVVARHAPCPDCVRYHLATGTDVAYPGGATAELDTDAVQRFVRSDAFADALRSVAATRRAAAVTDPERGEVLRHGVAWAYPACAHESLPAGPPSDAELPPSASPLRDPWFGLVRRVADVPAAADSPVADLHVAASRAVNPAHPRDPGRVSPFLHASGVGETAADARLRATMEAVERVAAMRPTVDATVAAEADLGPAAVPPTAFHWYAPAQYESDGFACAPYDPAGTYEWAACVDWATGERLRVPSGLVSLAPAADEDRLTYATTSGFAAHFSLQDAVRNAALELVERDAVLHHWYAQTARPRVRHDALPASLRERVRSFEDAGYEVAVVDATRRPPFACIEVFGLDGDGYPMVVSAAGCDTDPAAAMHDALSEAADTYRSMVAGDRPPVPDRESVTRTNDHLAFYQRADRVERLREWLHAGSTVAFEAVGGDATGADDVASLLADCDVRVLYVDVTPTSVAAASGRVVRALSPDLLPMTFGHGRERLAHPDEDRTLDRATDLPHPFA